ncbi:MAG: hypothetical protein U0Q16_27755 [Bryobacteraceae bacterium]
MPFQSEFGDSDKLNACAVNDPDHVGEQFSSKGPWVVLIKKALNAWSAKQRPALPALASNDSFDRDTGDRVALYKLRHAPPILNYQGKIDRIVGKKTVAALDLELPAKATPTPAITMSALAQRDRATSLDWARSAVKFLTEALAFLVTPPPPPIPGMPPLMPPRVGLAFTALEIHFHISTAAISKEDFIRKVIEIYQKDINVLVSSASFFIDDTTSAEATKGTPAHVPFGSGKVNFTPAFRERSGAKGFGPNCRAAMVLHEPIHVVDHPAASSGANHVHERDAKYEAQPAMNQLHNAHSYACFAQHVHFGRDERFGIGRPAE